MRRPLDVVAEGPAPQGQQALGVARQRELAVGVEGWRNLEHHAKGRFWERLPRAVVPPGFLDRVCARGTLSSSAEGWSQETANSTPTMQIVGMWNPAEGTGYEPPGVIHPLDVLFIANGEEDMRRITELATTHMQREEFLAGEFTLAKVVERKGDFLETGLTSVDEAIAKEKAGDLDVMAEFEEKARLAARSNNLETLEQMVDDQKVDKDTADRKGNTLLILAAQQGDKKICKYLLRRGANINKTNFAGNSVLHYCYEYHRDDLAEYLKSVGADDSIENGMGLTCYEGLTSDEVEAI